MWIKYLLAIILLYFRFLLFQCKIISVPSDSRSGRCEEGAQCLPLVSFKQVFFFQKDCFSDQNYFLWSRTVFLRSLTFSWLLWNIFSSNYRLYFSAFRKNVTRIFLNLGPRKFLSSLPRFVTHHTPLCAVIRDMWCVENSLQSMLAKWLKSQQPIGIYSTCNILRFFMLCFSVFNVIKNQSNSSEAPGISLKMVELIWNHTNTECSRGMHERCFVIRQKRKISCSCL